MICIPPRGACGGVAKDPVRRQLSYLELPDLEEGQEGQISGMIDICTGYCYRGSWKGNHGGVRRDLGRR